MFTKAFQAIINQGIDVNATNGQKVTALMKACAEGNKEAINVFLNAGADPNIADADGDTCLHYATRNDYCIEVLQAIISHSVNVNATNKRNTTALMIACFKGNKDAVNVLLNAEADPNIADAHGDTILHYTALNYWCIDVLRVIISQVVDVNATNKKNVTALMNACVDENEDAINVILNAGADLNIADADGDTCLHYAVQTDCCTEIFQAIISHGVDVNATTLDHGAPVNAANKNHQTAYMLAYVRET